MSKPTAGAELESLGSLTLETVRQQHPDIAQALRAEGASAERTRIQDVLGVCLPGHEALINTLAFDGQTTGAQAAQRVIDLERRARAKQLAMIESDAPAPVPHTGVPDMDREHAVAADPQDLGKRARAKVREAAADGLTLSLASAMKQVHTEDSHA